jgi:hypothetical protein
MFRAELVKIAKAFHSANIPYLVIGGQAVLLYGESRLTNDIDITLGIDSSHFKTIKNITESNGYFSDVDENFVLRTNVFPVINTESGIRVDLIFSYTEYERIAIERTNSYTIENTSICFASIEDVIIHKIFAGRARDLDDVRGILIRNLPFDKSYIEHWLHIFELELGKDYLKTFAKILESER